jgi:hypothetical protein
MTDASVQHGFRLFHVEPGPRADLEARLGEGQDALLNPDVVLCDLDPLLGNAVLHVIRRRVGQQRHQGIVIVFDRSVQTGTGRFDGPAEAAPEIQLPAQTQAGRPIGIPVGEWTVRENAVEEGRVVSLIAAQSDTAVLPGGFLALREDIAHGDLLLRPRLKDAHADGAQGQVLLVGATDEGIERRVVEHGPPILEVAILDVGIVGLDPLRGDRRRRLAVIGANESVLA